MTSMLVKDFCKKQQTLSAQYKQNIPTGDPPTSKPQTTQLVNSLKASSNSLRGLPSTSLITTPKHSRGRPLLCTSGSYSSSWKLCAASQGDLFWALATGNLTCWRSVGGPSPRRSQCSTNARVTVCQPNMEPGRQFFIDYCPLSRAPTGSMFVWASVTEPAFLKGQMHRNIGAIIKIPIWYMGRSILRVI